MWTVYIVLNVRTNVELESFWKRSRRSVIEILFRNLSGGTEEDHDVPQSECLVSRPVFEWNTSSNTNIERHRYTAHSEKCCMNIKIWPLTNSAVEVFKYLRLETR
jgi:hypothetical protein